MHRQIAGKLTSPVTKWIVVAVWVVLLVGVGGLSAKLADVQNNEASSWLPASAESTKVVDELTGTVDPNDIPTLIVYYRDGGLTDADRAAIEEQATELGNIDGVVDQEVLTPGAAEQIPDLPFQLSSDDGEVAVST